MNFEETRDYIYSILEETLQKLSHLCTPNCMESCSDQCLIGMAFTNIADLQSFIEDITEEDLVVINVSDN